MSGPPGAGLVCACRPARAPFAGWFADMAFAAGRRDTLPHQLALLDARDRSILLIAPTGGGKTLAGFLPSLVGLARVPRPGLHTLYVSPLKALAADIRRNLQTPIREMGLPVRVEDRTGDTGAAARRRQRVDPPHILLTTPESLALLLSYEEAPRIFAGLERVVVDEVHALAESKRGDQLALGLARLGSAGPGPRPSGSRRRWTIPRGSRPSSRREPASSRPIRAPIPTSRSSRPRRRRPGRARAGITRRGRCSIWCARTRRR
jgi:hypothetical protein